MDQIEKIRRGLQDTMTVMEALERRNANRVQEHQEWLEALNKGWAQHQKWLEDHERAMAEFDVRMANLNEAITRFIQGRNVN